MAERHGKAGNRLRKSKICQERRIKVLPINYDYRPKAQQNKPHFVTDNVPWIQMKGKWLEQAGFAIHTPVTVRVMKGCLVLTAEASTDS